MSAPQAVRPPNAMWGRRRGQVSRPQLQPLVRRPVIELPAEPERPGRQVGRLLPPAGHRRRRAGARIGAGELDPRRRIEPDAALAAKVGEPAQRPVEAVAPGGPGHGLNPAHLEGPGQRSEPDAGVPDIERRLPGLGPPEGRHREVELRLPAVGRRLAADLEPVVPPHQIAGQRREALGVDARDLARERSPEVMPALELVERAAEVSETGGGEVVAGEEDLPHAREVDVRFERVGHLGEVPHVDVPLEARRRAIGLQVDPGQPDVGAIEQEVGLQADPHRLEVADPEDATGRGGMAAVVEDLGDREVQVRQADAPVRPVVLEAKLAPGRVQVLQRGHETPPGLRVRLGRVRAHGLPLPGRELYRRAGGGLRIRLPHEGGEALAAVGKRLRQHLPVPHEHCVGEELAVQQRRPDHRQRDLLGHEEGPIIRVQPADGEILDDEPAAQQADTDPADADIALEIAAQRLLRPGADGGAEVDRHDRDERHRHQDGGPRDAPPQVPAGPPRGPRRATRARRGLRRRIRRRLRRRIRIRNAR